MHKYTRALLMKNTKSVIDFKSKICLHYRFVNIIMEFCSGFNEKNFFFSFFLLFIGVAEWYTVRCLTVYNESNV